MLLEAVVNSLEAFQTHSSSSVFARIVAILIIILLAFTGFKMISYSDMIIKDKVSSYSDLKTAGAWIKENSDKSTIIISAAIPEITYYSERATYGHLENWSSELDTLSKNKSLLLVTDWERDPDWLYASLSQNQSILKQIYQSTSTYNGQKMFAVVLST